MQVWLVGVTVAVLFLAWCVVVFTGNAGPDPAKWLLHESGFYALVYLSATLAVSPLARVVKKPTLVLWRRPLGLAGFVVACAHLLIYTTVYQGLLWAAILEDIAKRPYILIGFAAWLMLVPLAATSTRVARRRMGSAWAKLHRLVYVLVPLAILHQGLAQKADLGQTLLFSAFVACFLIERMVRAHR